MPPQSQDSIDMSGPWVKRNMGTASVVLLSRPKIRVNELEDPIGSSTGDLNLQENVLLLTL